MQLAVVKSRPYVEPVQLAYRKHVGPTLDPILKVVADRLTSTATLVLKTVDLYTKDLQRNFWPFVNYHAAEAKKLLQPVLAHIATLADQTVQWLQKNVFT